MPMKNLLTRIHGDQRGSGDGAFLFGCAIALAAIFAVGYGIYWAGSTASAESNERCVVYSGGTFEDKEFAGFIEAGQTNKVIGWGSKSRCYWNDQRSYIGSDTNPNADTKAVRISCRGGDVVAGEDAGDTSSQISVDFDYNSNLSLNTSDEALKAFDREIGQKTKAYKGDAEWKEMLGTYLEPQYTRAMQDAGTDYSCLDLVGSAKVRGEYQKDVVRLFKKNLEEVLKGDYFCSPNYQGRKGEECGDITFKISNPTLPKTIREAIENRLKARQDTATQVEKNNTATKKLIIDDELIKRYGADGALLYKAIESGKVQIMVLPNGQSVAVPAG